jgi:hypothetical protein
MRTTFRSPALPRPVTGVDRPADVFERPDAHIDRHLVGYQAVTWVVIALGSVAVGIWVALTPLAVLRQYRQYLPY